MSIGWDNQSAKDLNIDIPASVSLSSGWVTLRSWGIGELAGKVAVGVELYGTLPTTRPTDIQIRLLRPDVDPTKRTGLTVGTMTAWAESRVLGLEDIGPDDLPLELQVWRKGGSSGMKITTVITKLFAPVDYIAGRLV